MRRERGKSRGLFWVTLSAALALAILAALGTWQLQRMAWKEALIEQIAVRAKAEPIFLDGAATLFRAGEDLEYTPVRARGRFLHNQEMFYFASGPKGPGYHVYTPLIGPSGDVLLVNRGFITEGERKLDRSLGSDPAPLSEVVGLLRSPEKKSLFAPANDRDHNLWFWRDQKGMADQALGAGSEARKKALPFFIEAVSAPAGAELRPGTPRGGVTRLELPNRHLEYALTWFGLGLALIGVYVVFVRNRLQANRERFILGASGGASRRRSWGKT